MAQRKDTSIVVAAISALGDVGGAEAVQVLVDNIACPWVGAPLPAGVKDIPMPPMFIDMHIMGTGGLLFDAFPAAKALVRIGDTCIPQVLAKLAGTDDPTVRNACLDLLIELKTRAQVKSLIEAKRDSARSSEDVRRLQLALTMLPGLDNQAAAYTGWRSELMNPDGNEDRAALMGRIQLKLAPVVMLGISRSTGKTVEVSGVTLTSAKELALIFGGPARQDGNRVTFSDTQTPPKTLVLEVGSKIASAGTVNIQLPVAPIRSGNGILVPLRAVAEHFGAPVKWNPATRIAKLVALSGLDLQ